MEVQTDLKDAFRFSEYDSGTNTFKVHGYMVAPEDVGTYPITLIAKFFNETHVETFEDIFYLTVWDDPVIPPEPWFPPDPIEYPNWDGSIRESQELGEFHID